MSTKCLVVCDNELMIAGIEALLARQVSMDVYSLSNHIDEEMAQTVKTMHPDVILLDEDLRETSPVELLKMLKRLPNMQVIVFNERNNKLLVYRDMQLEVRHMRNLADVILGSSHHPRGS